VGGSTPTPDNSNPARCPPFYPASRLTHSLLISIKHSVSRCDASDFNYSSPTSWKSPQTSDDRKGLLLCCAN